MLKKLFVGSFEGELAGKIVFLRTDLNVLLVRDDTQSDTILPFMVKVADDSCIGNSMKTIRFLNEQRAKTVVCSHIHDFDDSTDPPPSMEVVALKLEHELRECKAIVKYVNDSVGDDVEVEIQAMQEGDVLVLENIAYYEKEFVGRNDEEFCRKLASAAEIFVFDNFGVSHKKLTSTVGVAQHIPVRCMGLQMREELSLLITAFESAAHPLAVIIGGNQVTARLRSILELVNVPNKVHKVLVAGAVVFAFYGAMGVNVGDVVLTEEQVQLAHTIKQAADRSGVSLVLASDSRVVPTELLMEQKRQEQVKSMRDEARSDPLGAPISSALNLDYSTHKVIQLGVKRVPLSMSPNPPGVLFEPAIKGRVAKNDGIPQGFTPVDVGEESLRKLCDELASYKTILWCGPVGMCENPDYAHGTVSLMQYMSHLTEHGATTIVCGGDTAAAVHHRRYQMRQENLAQGAAAETNKSGEERGEQGEQAALHFSYTSRGSAALSLLAEEELPGLEILDDQE